MPVRQQPWFLLLWLAAGCAEEPSPEDLARRGEFLQLAETARAALSGDTGVAYFQEAYAVRALAVAYDLTGDPDTLAACVDWSSRMAEAQSGMIPAGAYDMNYGRSPGESSGDWFVADSATIGMAVLATARRVTDPSERGNLLDSARSFAACLADFTRPSGGITDGFWPVSDQEWWCSTALGAAFLLLLHQETGEAAPLATALSALDWLLQFDPEAEASNPTFADGAPAVWMYTLEAYAAALELGVLDATRRTRVGAAYRHAIEWMLEHQRPDGGFGFEGHWGDKEPGLAFHLMVYRRLVGDDPPVGAAIDRAFAGLSARAGELASGWSQALVFGLLSYAERVKPGAVY
jgi:hypothetical protein